MCVFVFMAIHRMLSEDTKASIQNAIYGKKTPSESLKYRQETCIIDICDYF